MSAAPVHEAAQALGVRPGTLRRWLRDGCPVARRGGRGRGRATLVDVCEVARWRDARERSPCEAVLIGLAADVPEIVADATLCALAAASPLTQGGGERNRLQRALADAA